MATNDSLIQVKNLKKHYHRGAIKALDGVTADINKGDVMVVIGPSGSGKSTFLRSLNLLEEPTDGEIIFNGVDITRASGTCWTCRPCRGISDPALRWTETACCNRKSTCDGTGSDAL